MPKSSAEYLEPEGDALSDVLQAIHLRGSDVRHTIARSGPVHETRAGTRVLYVVERGRLRLRLADGDVVVDSEGLALVPTGATHALRAEEGTAWITGTFEVEDEIADPILRVLPAVITIEAGERTRPWLAIATGLIAEELPEFNPGGRVMVSRVLDLFFIRALRDWAHTRQTGEGSVLAAVMDQAVGRALTRVQRDPGRAWSLDELARVAGLSRSAFSARFTELVGMPPGRFVAERRLAHAEHLLLTTDMPIGSVAARAGYASEAAFSRAFGARFGTSPRAHRTRAG